MPIYEYSCSECAHNFEEWVKSVCDAEGDSCPCPQCGASSFRKMSHTSFVLKGGGWYVTEYGGKPTREETSSPKESANTDKKASSASETSSTSAKSTTSTPSA